MNPSSPLYQEKYRPQFHFTARQWASEILNPERRQEGWLNDPNGLVYLDGEYHLFAQRWAECWIHAVSRDLVHWEELPPAFWHDEADEGGVQSGSAIIDVKNTSGLGAGGAPPMIAFYSKWNNREQCLVYSNDRGRTWTKYERNPILVHGDRDPKVFWHEPHEKWVMVLYTDPEHCFELFSSRNLVDWKKLSNSRIPEMFECPDMFELPVDGNSDDMKWVVLDGSHSYYIGLFDGERFVPESEKLRGEFGCSYATQSWNCMPDSDRRRIQISWVKGTYPEMPFSQQISFPCELVLRRLSEGVRMCKYPIDEIRLLHGDERVRRDIALSPDMNTLPLDGGELLDVELEIELAGAAELAIELRGCVLSYDAAQEQLRVGDASAPFKAREGAIDLRVLVDRSSMEVFGNGGEVSLTAGVLPQESDTAIRAAAKGGSAVVKSLTVRGLRSIW